MAYSNATLALGLVAIMGISSCVSVRASERAGERSSRQVIAEQAAARERADERARQSVCAVTNRMVRVYSNPDVSEVGRDARRAWEDLSKLFQCDGK